LKRVRVARGDGFEPETVNLVTHVLDIENMGDQIGL
jgi:hypothetical protein